MSARSRVFVLPSLLIVASALANCGDQAESGDRADDGGQRDDAAVGAPLDGSEPAANDAGNPSGSDAAALDTGTPPADAGTDGASPGDASPEGGTVVLDDFSFFVTSLAALRRLSESANGFGGDLRYRETGAGAGLRGADKICTEIAESSMPGAGAKGWRAFLSTSTVHAKDRIGSGPWYDRRGRLVAANLTDLLKLRPAGAASAIVDDLPNESGTPNHNPDGAGEVDNHDTLTASDAAGSYDDGSTCDDWTSTSASGSPGIGHSWCPANGLCGGGSSSRNWIAAHTAHGCRPSVNLSSAGGGGPNNGGVGDSGGYGGFYCFALTR